MQIVKSLFLALAGLGIVAPTQDVHALDSDAVRDWRGGMQQAIAEAMLEFEAQTVARSDQDAQPGSPNELERFEEGLRLTRSNHQFEFATGGVLLRADDTSWS